MDARDHDAQEAALGRFARMVSASPPATLDALALAISGVLQPGLDEARWMAELDELADSCPDKTRDGVVEHLFASGRFHGDTATYRSWRNSCLDYVLTAGRGIPITLSVVAIEVGRRIGVPLVGIGMPSHFLLGDAGTSDWFCDPFSGGRIMDADGCRALYGAVRGNVAGWDPSFLTPSSALEIVARMLNNLTVSFGPGDKVRLALVARLRVAVPGQMASRRAAERDMAVLN